MLGDPVIVADDGSRSKSCACAKSGIADIGEMIGFGAIFDHRLLDLDEVSDVHFGAKLCSWTQPRKRSDQRALADVSMIEMRKRTGHCIVFDGHARAED